MIAKLRKVERHKAPMSRQASICSSPGFRQVASGAMMVQIATSIALRGNIRRCGYAVDAYVAVERAHQTLESIHHHRHGISLSDPPDCGCALVRRH
jgi:hypothetical protein